MANATAARVRGFSAVAPADRMTASPAMARLTLVCMLLAAVAVGLLATGGDAASQAAAQADGDLTRLLRAMAALKAIMAAGAAAAVLWRLGTPVTLSWLAAYAAAAGAMAAGPGMIWGMAHVGLGAALLHGGLLATVLLLWRDPALSARLSTIVATRRAALRAAR